MSDNIKNINHNDFPNICRTCLNICKTKFFENDVISSIFYKLTDIHFKTNDDLPQQICINCFEKINEIHEFASRCKQSHSTLTNCLNTRISEEEDVIKSSDQQEGHIFEIKLEENITNDEEINTKVKDENLDPLHVDIKDEVKTENDLEITELNVNIIPETSDINGGQNINCFENVYENTEVSKNEDWKDLKEETYTSQSSAILIKDSVKNKSQLKCEDCDKTFTTLKSLKGHKRRQSFNCPYKCKQCSKTFTHLDELKRHMRTHTGERPFKCDQCLKSFTQSCHLKGHMRTHNGARPYKCDQCSKSFTRSDTLQKHRTIHSGERSYKCDQCSKSFNQLSHLKRHMLIHNGERSYKCDQCLKSFARLDDLKRHMRTHTGERPYCCKQCSKSFRHSQSLNEHMRIHSGDLPDKC